MARQGVLAIWAERGTELFAVDIFIASAIVNRWVAVPCFALVAAFYQFDSLTSTGFVGFTLVACAYGAAGCFTRRVIESEIRDLLARRTLSKHEPPTSNDTNLQ